MKIILVNLILLLSLNGFAQSKILPEDLKIIIGSWEGSITYLDYRTNKPFNMPANLIVKQGKKENTLILNNIYPKEPKANDTDKIKVAKNGMLLNKSLVTSRIELENGDIKILTEHKGKDDNKKAVIRNTYLIGKNLFVVTKEVQFEENGNWIKRSELNYHKKM